MHCPSVQTGFCKADPAADMFLLVTHNAVSSIVIQDLITGADAPCTG